MTQDHNTSQSNTASGEHDEFVRLDGAQRELRDSFFAADSGLFVLNSDPGAGKSTTGTHIVAELLAKLEASGVPAPEERVAVVSFSRDDAAGIAPAIAAAIETQARDPESAVDLPPERAEALGNRVKQASNIGTVDSVLQSLFERIAPELGFGDEVRVETAAGLREIRSACLAHLRQHDTLAATFERLQTAYPGESEYRADAGQILVESQIACRERQLSVAAFQDRLETIVEEQYPPGGPDGFGDVHAAIRRLLDADKAEKYAAERTGQERSDIGAADADLYEVWTDAIDDLCDLLEAYQTVYDERTKAHGVVSHLDVSHWTARFFADTAYASEFRERLVARYHSRLQAVVIDEAQDVSTAQHAAIAPLVDTETRVVAVGDLKQLIYLWRNAQPALFRRAIDDGVYFDIDWATHVVKYEHETRRSRPAIAAAIDTVFESVFTDPARGADETVVDEYTPLEPVREPGPGPRIHIPAVPSTAEPGRESYVKSNKEVGEAAALARTLAAGLADGRLSDGEDGPPTVTVLTHRRKYIDTLVEQFERVGLSAGNSAALLFDHPLVKLLVELCTAVAAADPEAQLKRLIYDREDAESRVGPLDDTILAASDADTPLFFYDSIDGVLSETDPTEPELSLLHTFGTLTQRQADLTSKPPAAAIETIVDEFGLWTDPLDLADDPHRYTVALDTLLTYVKEISQRDSVGFVDTVEHLARLHQQPTSGPDIPLHDASRYDIVIKTIFGMKGGEADVIALADIGQHIGEQGPHTDTFYTQGSTVGLAPPGTKTAAATPSLPGLSHGLFTVDRDPWDYDAGLRWASQQWAAETRLAGSETLSTMAHAHRAGRWRLLYVALSRARNHLVIPLPATRETPEPRDYWIDTLRAAFDFDSAGVTDGVYTCTAPNGRPFDIRVHDCTTEPEVAADRDTSDQRTPMAATPAETLQQTFTPRFVNPSTLYHLLDDPEAHIIDYLQNRQLVSDGKPVSEGLSLDVDSLGSEDIGDIVHECIGAVLQARKDVSREDLRHCAGTVPETLAATVDMHSQLSRTERKSLMRFLRETICPQLADSTLWTRVEQADAVYIEEPADTVERLATLDTEMLSFADVVTQTGSNWAVTELKVVLHHRSAAITPRFELQAQLYAWVLSQQPDVAAVDAHLLQLGVDMTENRVDWDRRLLEDKLLKTRALF